MLVNIGNAQKLVIIFTGQVTILIWLILITPLQVFPFTFSHNTKLFGVINESSTGNPLPAANISVKSKKIGTTTDSNGNYSIMLEPGRYEIEFRYMGYQTEKKTITIPAHKDQIELNIYLKPAPVKGQEVSIIAPADEPKITRYELPPAKMRTIANPLPDALLSLKTLPGVFSGNDQSTFY
ncbi:hypothetical protein GF337_05790, partial [candidate division KSB1 bacterium]|nr:hypothetical protein [candidate division KSB1 bacterium]